MTMKASPPSSVRFPAHQENGDQSERYYHVNDDNDNDCDRSELTGPCEHYADHHCHYEPSPAASRRERQDRFGKSIASKLREQRDRDPNFYDELDGTKGLSNRRASVPSPHHHHHDRNHHSPRPRLYLQGADDDGIAIVDVLPIKAIVREQQIADLELRIAEQQERLDVLASELSRARAENESLKAENASLAGDLVTAAVSGKEEAAKELEAAAAIEEQPPRSSVRHRSSLLARGLSLRTSFGMGTSSSHGGNATTANPSNASKNNAGAAAAAAAAAAPTVELLANANARLTGENSRLRISVDGLRKSFQSHVKTSRRNGRADREIIMSLEDDIDDLLGRLPEEEYHRAEEEEEEEERALLLREGPRETPLVGIEKTSSLGEDTAKTSSADSDFTEDVHRDDASVQRALEMFEESKEREDREKTKLRTSGGGSSNHRLDVSEGTWMIEGEDIESFENLFEMDSKEPKKAKKERHFLAIDLPEEEIAKEETKKERESKKKKKRDEKKKQTRYEPTTMGTEKKDKQQQYIEPKMAEKKQYLVAKDDTVVHVKLNDVAVPKRADKKHQQEQHRHGIAVANENAENKNDTDSVYAVLDEEEEHAVAHRLSEELLVDFGEPRSRSTRRAVTKRRFLG
jgi:hypothetical protein